MVSALESKLLGDKKKAPVAKPSLIVTPPEVIQQPPTPVQAPAAPVENHEVAANEPPTPAEVLMGFSMMKPDDVFLYGIDEVPKGFDEKLLAPFADPYRLAYDDSNPGYVAYKQVLKDWGRVKKPAWIVPVTSNNITLFVANDGRQTTKLARELGFTIMPVLSLNESDAKEIALYTVGANTGIKDSILVLAAKAQGLVDLKIPQRTIAPRFGIVQSTLNNWLKLNKASDYLKQLIVNHEAGVSPGVPWTTASTMIQKKWTDAQIKTAIEGASTASEEGEEGDGDGGTEGEGEGGGEQTAAPAKATAASIFGSFKEDILAVVNTKGFELPESLSKATPVELFILGLETAFAKKTDALAEDFRKTLNEKMARARKNRENKAKKAAEKATPSK